MLVPGRLDALEHCLALVGCLGTEVPALVAACVLHPDPVRGRFMPQVGLAREVGLRRVHSEQLWQLLPGGTAGSSLLALVLLLLLQLLVLLLVGDVALAVLPG
eukprot:8879570-Lingulodinium_polyedra.AAC.1